MKKKWIITAVLASCLLVGCANPMEDGIEQLEEGNYTEAEANFQEALTEEEDTAEAYRALGMLYYEQDDFQKARENLQAALDNGAEATPVIYNLIALSSMKLDDLDGAIAAYENGIALAGMSTEEVDYSTVIQEMRFNQIACYEKKYDWENAKAKIAGYVADYPEDTAAQKEAEFLQTR